MYQKGFTLIELMIVVAIISIIAMIAYPSYTESVRKSKRSDAMISLQEVAAAQERRFSMNNRYSNDMNDLGGSTSREGNYTIAVTFLDGNPSQCSSSDQNCFLATATAVGDQLDDTNCRSLTINSFGQKASYNAGGSTSDCW